MGGSPSYPIFMRCLTVDFCLGGRGTHPACAFRPKCTAGGPQRRHGANGHAEVVDVPLGTVVYRDTISKPRPGRLAASEPGGDGSAAANAAAAVQLAEDEGFAHPGRPERGEPQTPHPHPDTGPEGDPHDRRQAVMNTASRIPSGVDGTPGISETSSTGGGGSSSGAGDDGAVAQPSDGHKEESGDDDDGAPARGSRQQLDSLPVVADLVAEGQEAVVAAGGGGGRGNATFRNKPDRPASRRHEAGEPGPQLSHGSRDDKHSPSGWHAMHVEKRSVTCLSNHPARNPKTLKL